MEGIYGPLNNLPFKNMFLATASNIFYFSPLMKPSYSILNISLSAR